MAALQNLLYYCYAPLGVDGRNRVSRALTESAAGALTGRVRVGLDGVNASVSGPRDALDAHSALVASLPDLATSLPIDWKISPVLASRADADPRFPTSLFTSFVVTRVAEIVTLNAPSATPGDVMHTGRHATPQEFHSLLSEPNPAGAVLIDVRNVYEHDIGVFEPSPCSNLALLRPSVRRFEEMPSWVETNAHILSAAPRIAMYCTGGIRCERFSALVRERFPDADVVQLAGGVQRYMEAAEGGVTGASHEGAVQGSRWRGRLFNFDDRPPVRCVTDVAPDASPHLPGVVGVCVRCAAPWDQYAWLRCCGCGILVLVCNDCVAGGGGAEAVKPTLTCAACIAGAPLGAQRRVPKKGRVKRAPRPDLVAAAAARRAAAAGVEGAAVDEAEDGVALGAFFSDD